MRLIRSLCKFATCAVLCLPYVANAATVTNQGGIVLVNKGKGFSRLVNKTELTPGDQVMVNPGGLAKITYSDDCAIQASPGIWQVQAAAPCAKGPAEIVTSSVIEPAPELSGTWLLIGGGVVGGGLLIGCIADWCKGSKSASP